MVCSTRGATGKGVICRSFAYVLSQSDDVKRLVNAEDVERLKSEESRERIDGRPDEALTYSRGSRSYLSGLNLRLRDGNNRLASKVNFRSRVGDTL